MLVNYVPSTPTNITAALVNGTNLSLSRPANHLGWRLLVQTDHLNLSLSANPLDWDMVAGSAATNRVTRAIDPARPGEFYRLVYP